MQPKIKKKKNSKTHGKGKKKGKELPRQHEYSEAAQISSVNTGQEHVYGEIPLNDIKGQHSYQNLEGLTDEETTSNTAKETTDQDPYHIYEVPKDENTSDQSQKDVYDNKPLS